MTLRRRTLRIATFWIAIALAFSACGTGTQPLDIQVTTTSLSERIPLDLLVAKIYTVVERTEVVATATSPDGQTVTAVSCQVLAAFAPTSTGCVETQDTVQRDDELIFSGAVGNNGTVRIERPPSNLRIYVDLPSDQLRMDEHGHICRWNGRHDVPADADAVIVAVNAIC